ncbi:SMC family ATPase [Bacillus mexicanus]|uniref:AAA family ATPase n=1 Tax=Bacillus mexicanus TaxID=2834415 RepID=UPI003D19667E
MKIKRIRGEYVRQYESIDIEFEEGFFNINGSNGSGKTTILTLIELALFGSISGEVKSSEIKYDQAKKNQKWWLELTFVIDDNEFTVFRHETSAKAKLDINGKSLITGGQKEVTNHIAHKLLRMDQSSFVNAFYAQQDDFDNLIKLSPEKRKKEISRLLRLDKLDLALKKVREDKNHLVTIIDEQSRHIKNKEFYIEQEKELNESILSIKDKEKQKLRETKLIEKTYNALLEKKTKLDAKYENHQDINTKITSKNQEKNHLNDMILTPLIAELAEIEKHKKEFSSLQLEIEEYDLSVSLLQKLQQIRVLFVQKKQLESLISDLKTNLSAKKERIDKLKKTLPQTDYKSELTNVDKQIEEIEKNITALNNVIIELKSNHSYITNEGKRIKSERSNLHTLGENSTCPICKRTMGDHFYSLSRDYESNLTHLAKEHKNLTNEIKKKEKEKNDNQEKIMSLKKIKLDLEKKSQQLFQLENELSYLKNDFLKDKTHYLKVEKQLKELGEIKFDEQEYNKLLEKTNMLQKKKDRFNILTSIIAKESKLLENKQKIENQISCLNTEVLELNKNLKKIAFDIDTYKSFQEKINTKVSELRQSEKELSLILEQSKSLNTSLQHLFNDKKENEIKTTELEKRKKELSLLIKSEEIFKNYKIRRMSAARPKMQQIMQELLAYITDGKYDLVEIDEHYNVFVYRNKISQPLHRFSGGEKKLIALCMRLAISRILTSKGEHQNFDYLALDEVLGSQDESRQETIISALRKLTTIFKQIFMITHNSNIKDLFDKTLQVEQNQDLSSKAFWISSDDQHF